MNDYASLMRRLEAVKIEIDALAVIELNLATKLKVAYQLFNELDKDIRKVQQQNDVSPEYLSMINKQGKFNA